MGTLFSAFDIARSGLNVAQIQLDTAGHNIANVNKIGFSRQRVELISRVPITKTFGQIGRGVAVAQISRLRDEFLDVAFRRQVPGLAGAEIRAEFFTRIEDIFLEPGPNGLSGRLNIFFDSLNEFANNVESQAVRQSVVSEAQALVSLFIETAERLNLLRTNANDNVLNSVPSINSITQQIAALNGRIRTIELGGQPANDLRDDRGVLLDTLAGLVNITTRERLDGEIDVLVSGDELVIADRFRIIEAIRVPALDPERNDLVELRFADNGNTFNVTKGSIFALLDLRDNAIVNVDARIDTLAGTIIEQINLIHTQGNGIANLSGTVSSTNPATDAVTALDLAGLPFPVTTGSFDVTVFDSTGAVVGTATIAVTTGATTLTTLAAALSAFNPNFSASVSGGNTLDMTAAAGFSFTLSNDTSGVLTALGTNVLFTGTDARTIGVNTLIVQNPSLLSSAFDTTVLNTGANQAALALAEVRDGLFLDGNASTINDFYETTITIIGVDTRSNLASLETERTFVETFERRRLEASGVSLDEEITLLLQFQRAFEASARVITVTDRMLESLLLMAR